MARNSSTGALHILTRRLCAAASIALAAIPLMARGGLVTSTGYTNAFTGAPPSPADFVSLSSGSSSGAITDVAGMNAAVQLLSASSFSTPVSSAVNDPPDAAVATTWAASGYIQSRPTTVDALFTLCKLTNGLGVHASSVTVGYVMGKTLPVTEEVDGLRGYYSFSGNPGTWTPVPEFSGSSAGTFSVTLNTLWTNGTPLYILWADDNGSGTPDTAFSIDNFFATAVPANQAGASITNAPQSQTVAELASATFTVGVGGFPPPTIQWYTNGVAIAGATNTTYTIASTPYALNGVQFTVVAQNTASNLNYSVTSAPPAVLTVTPDTVAPTLVGAIASGLNQVVLSFSEPVRAATATNVANYSISGLAGTLTITNASLDATQTNVTFTVSTMVPGSNYTITVSGVTDLSAAANAIAPNSQAFFTAAATAIANIGNPSAVGQVTAAGSGFNVSGVGTNIGGTADQLTFAYQQVNGDFDVKVRLPSFTAPDGFARAGLMARESLDAGSRFAASLASPGVTASSFSYRDNLGAAAITTGWFPANYPYTWLRLARVGNVFTGYGSLDGQTWVQLGTATIPMSGTVYFGMAVASTTSSDLAVVQFRDQQSAAGGTVIPSPQFSREPLSASSRRTGLVISELMYNPKGRPDGKQLEFIEIYNSMSIFEDMSGYRLSGDVDFTFPTGTVLRAGQFLVLAKVAADVESAYGLSGVFQYGVTNYATNVIAGETNVAIVYETNVVQGVTNVRPRMVNSLNNGGGTLRLHNRAGAVLLRIDWQTRSPWPVAADGTGHSMVLARASYGENNPKAWLPSDLIGGSPGTFDSMGPEPARNVVINEFLAHTDPPLEDTIELYNHGTTPVDISGLWLSDSFSTNKFRIPDGTMLAPRGFIAFSQTQLGFALSGDGEQIVLVNSNQNRVLDLIKYEGQENGISFGRYPDGAPTFRRLAARTFGTTNAPPLLSPVVINEIMYAPISGNGDEEYIELYNRSGAPVNLGEWRFVSGIDYTFPKNTILSPGGYLVVAKNAARLRTNHTVLNLTNCLGNFSGSLANSGERVALAAPDYETRTNNNVVTTNVSFWFVVNELTYGDGGKWGVWADGGGSSLELIDPNSDNSLDANWADSDETAKSQWTSFESTGAIDNFLAPPSPAQNADSLQVFLLGVGECMLDDIEVRTNGGPNVIQNPSFENGLLNWNLQGSHDQSFVDNTGGFTGRGLHLMAGSRGDNGVNRIRSTSFTPLTSTTTIRGKARWLRGFPEVLLRLRGGGLEAFGRLPVPSNLGTPGAPNSRAVPNAGPAIYDVVHTPALPAANESVRITARVHDADGVSNLVVRYRSAASPSTFVSVAMNDAGVGGDDVAGDGLFTATVAGQSAGTQIAFHVMGVDGANVTNLFPKAALSRSFPNDAPTHECSIRWGDTQMPGSFATYHLWFTDFSPDGVRQRWESRDRLNNAGLDGTFVYNNYRVIYNAKPQYGGSPWHAGSMNGPLNTGSRVDFVLNFPEDDELLGQTDYVLNTVGNPSGNDTSDTSGLAEQTSYEIFKGINVHYNYRRYIHVFFNGQQRSVAGNVVGTWIMEDSQQPNGDVISEWFPNDDEGQLYKIEDWFEFPDDGGNSTSKSNNDADLERRVTTVNGVNGLDLAPYRFMWRKRSIDAGDSANDYTNLFALIDIISPASAPTVSPLPDAQVKQLQQVIDLEQWMRIFAVQRTVGNWDSYGWERGKNAYSYRPDHGKFAQMTWDIDFTMGVGGRAASQSIFASTTDPRIAALYNTPEAVRAYYRAFQDIVNGPLTTNHLFPLIDARTRAFAANGVNYNPSTVATVKQYVIDRRNYLLTQIPTAAFTVANTSFATASNIVTISGTAPIDVKFIEIDGVMYPVTWTGSQTAPTSWSLRFPLSASGSKNYQLRALDWRSNVVAGTERTLAINYSGVIETPENTVVFNEVMFNPLVPGSEFIELFNRSSSFTFDLTGWRINGLDYTFPEGSVIAPRSFLVLTRDRVQFANVYGGAVPVFDQFTGSLQNGGETLTLVKPGTNGTEIEVDKIRYDSVAPWPLGADGTGSSLQVKDLNQDNSRVGNWSVRYVPPTYTPAISTPAQTNEGWRFVATTGTFGSNNRMLIFPDAAGTLYIDDLYLCLGSTPETGNNYIRNGNFEAPLGSEWIVPTNMTESTVATENVHSGNGALKMVAAVGGASSSLSRDLQQLISPAPTNGALCTLSFWYWATNNDITNLTIRIVGSQFSLSTNVDVFIIPSNYIPPQLITAATNYATPGATNTDFALLPPFQPLWINELQPNNEQGLVDNFGEREPWIEIYNASTNPVSLDDLYLSTTYTNLTNYAFPSGITLAPREFKVIWCDGEPGESSGNFVHTSFRLPSGSGSIALSRIYNGEVQVLDYVDYAGVHPNRSYGSFPDGQPFDRREFFYVTAGGTNNGTSAPLNVFINEWMASNTNSLADPADNQFEDWFELYNPGSTAVDLAGYYLTDSGTNAAGLVTNKFQFLITTNMAHIIPPGGHLLVWADNETGQNMSGGVARPDMHVNFALSKGGEAIGLFAGDGTQIDYVAFGAQYDDVSRGRFPDGSPNLYFMTNTATPRAANYVAGAGNVAPVLDVIDPITVFLTENVTFTAHATDVEAPPQTLTYTIEGAPPTATINPTTGVFSWTPSQVGTNTFTVRVTDSGTPELNDSQTVVVRVRAQPTFQTLSRSGTELTMTWGTLPGRSYKIVYKDDLAPGPWLDLFAQPLQASSETLSITFDISTPGHRFYRLVTLP